MKKTAVALTLLTLVSATSAQQVRPASWEFDVAGVTSWVQHGGERGSTANVGIMLASPNCPEGAVQMNFEVWPEIYLDEYTEWCEEGMKNLPGGRATINVLDHLFELRLQYGVNTDGSNWHLKGMTKDEFWTEVFAAQNAAIEGLYYRDLYFQNFPTNIWDR